MQVLERRSDGTPKVVELTEREQVLSETFEGFLDDGFGIRDAAMKVRSALIEGETVDVAFWLWLGL